MTGNPKYNNPPVVETVIGVQFPELRGFHAAHFGLYWETIRDRYAKVENRPTLEPDRERFPRQPIPLLPAIQALQRMPTNRVWFTDTSDSQLIQLQSDRFLFNWRQREGGYPLV